MSRRDTIRVAAVSGGHVAQVDEELEVLVAVVVAGDHQGVVAVVDVQQLLVLVAAGPGTWR